MDHPREEQKSEGKLLILVRPYFCLLRFRQIDSSSCRTEVVMDSLSPDFAKKFIIDYFFEERQVVEFQVYDSDSQSRNLAEHDALGGVQGIFFRRYFHYR
jgi:hypothetical protein